jgi:hypothetical protein
MRKLFSLLVIIAVGGCTTPAPKEPSHPLMASDTVVWAGLDYSKTRFIGPNDFNDPEAIFPGFLESWNSLFLRERIERMKASLGRNVVLDIGSVTERNKTAKADQITQTPGPEDAVDQTHITAADIAEAVKSYTLKATNGLGLVFIVDRLSKPEVKGAVYVVFFDVASREVVSSDRYVGRAGGFGFRNYWFGVIKQVDIKLKQYR